MFRARSCLIGMGIAIAGVAASTGCGGEEFGRADPGVGLDGSTDAKPPSNDGRSTGGSGGASGSGARGGASGTGGATGTGGTGATGGATGTGGAGATGGATGTGGAGATGGATGTGGAGGIGGNAGTDAGKSGSSSGDASSDTARDGGGSDATADGPSGDATADRSNDSDASPGDANNTDASNDNRSDASVADAADGCQPITYYKDDDSDGFGKTSESTSSCVPPSGKWSVLNGDCRDDLPNVKPFSPASPDPPQYSGTGYADGNKPQGVSFDYDCTGAEEADPTNAYGNEPDCPSILNCSGVGYIAVNPPRSGTGINPRCGSLQLKRCQVLFAEGAPALCNVTIEATTEVYRCR
jgi:hypothetical protein